MAPWVNLWRRCRHVKGPGVYESIDAEKFRGGVYARGSVYLGAVPPEGAVKLYRGPRLWNILPVAWQVDDCHGNLWLDGIPWAEDSGAPSTDVAYRSKLLLGGSSSGDPLHGDIQLM